MGASLRQRLMGWLSELRGQEAPPPDVIQRDERLDAVERRLAEIARRERLRLEAEVRRR